MDTTPVYHGDVPSSLAFARMQDDWRQSFSRNDDLHRRGTELFLLASQSRYNYLWQWCGVPVLRTPEDVFVLQEVLWTIRPQAVIETGVARGGGVVMSASLMAGLGLKPRVLGIDISIHDHTHAAIASSPWPDAIHLLEASSTSVQAINRVTEFVSAFQGHPALMILDSDHSEAHVLEELRVLTPSLPVGSVVIVADTAIEEMPPDMFLDRPWGPGDSPASAIEVFLRETPHFRRSEEWGRRALLSECPDGYLVKISAGS